MKTPKQIDRDAAQKFVESDKWLCEESWRDVHPGDQEKIASHFTAHRLVGVKQGRDAATAEIVAWLRGQNSKDSIEWGFASCFAAIIERGEHRKEASNG